MGFFQNHYPYTDFHEFNADWVLSQVQEFKEYLDTIRPIIEQLQTFYDLVNELQTEVNALSNEVGEYSGRISELETGIRNIRIMINNLENELIRMITDESNTRKAADKYLQDQIDQISQAIANVNTLYKYIQAVEKSLKQYIDASLSDTAHRILLYVNAQLAFLQNEIDDIYDKLLHVATNVYNWNAYDYAADGRISFDLNNKLLYMHLGNNLSAEEYCKLGLTADQYKAFNLTSWRYLMYGAKELHSDFVFMPVTGTRQNVSVALSDVLTFLCNTLTADQYAALDIDADAYAALDLTSSQYLKIDSNMDVQHNVTYSANGTGITSAQYACLNII